MQESLLEQPMASEYEDTLQNTVHRVLGYSGLSDAQESIIRASIAGEDVLGVLPTGGGKSACYQIPGIVTKSHTLVISPLIALQDDQVQNLRRLGIRAFALHSGIEESKRMAIELYYRFPRPGQTSFLYVSPELLLTDTFHHIFKSGCFSRIAVDEAHCVSTWGNSFRPDYQRIRIAVRRLQIPICSAFTATIDPRIERDIRSRVPLKPSHRYVAASPMRDNLKISVTLLKEARSNRSGSLHKRGILCNILAKQEYIGPSIIYCSTIDTAARLYLKLKQYKDWLSQHGFSVYLYHGHLPYEDKQMALAGFLTKQRPLVIATSAFGMGIDRADVRQVIHYQLPYALIDYAQQIGRAGRDGKPALCTTIFRPLDLYDREIKNIEWNTPEYTFVEKVHKWLRKIVANFDSAKKERYDLRSFYKTIEYRISNTDQVMNKKRYMEKVQQALALLQQAGIIKESDEGLEVSAIVPGGAAYLKLIDLTQMLLRTKTRELERVTGFFSHAQPSQELLWEILQQD